MQKWTVKDVNISQTGIGIALRKYGGSLIYVVIAVAAMYFASVLERAEIDRELTEMRLSLSETAGGLKAGIEREVTAHRILGIAVAGAIGRAAEDGRPLDQEGFERIVAPLIADRDGIVNVAAAPGLVVRYVYPLQPNQSVLGLDYSTVPAQMADIALVRQSGQLLYSGPVSLVQGGQGFIERVPVFIHDPDAGQQVFWGLVSIVVDQDQLFAAAGFDDIGRNTVVGVHVGNHQTPVWGDAGAFDLDPATSTFVVEGQQWTIALAPRNGWNSRSANYAPIWEMTGVITIAVLILVYLVRLSRSQHNAATRLLEAAVRSMQGGFVIYDADDRLVICNETYRSYHGAAALAVVPGASFEEIIRAAAACGEIPAAIGREEEWVAERVVSHRNLEQGPEIQLSNGHWVHSTESRTPDGGTVNFWTDITALKTAKDQAELASRTKTDFLNMVSHELRTPLTGILGFSAFLRQLHRLPSYKKLIQASAGAGSDPHGLEAAIEAFSSEVGTYARRIDEAGQNLSGLVNDLLDWSKLEAAAIKIDPVPVEMSELIRETVKKFEPIAKSKGLDLSWSGEPVVALGDAGRIGQVLVNIIGNALKFTAAGSIEVWTEADCDWVRVYVRDTGRGIAQGDLDSIFEHFKQADSSITRAYSGTGLGLAISRQIVQMHGGTISVESVEGQGSTFMFTLPRMVAAAGTATTERLAG